MEKFYTQTVAPTAEPIDVTDALDFLRADAADTSRVTSLISVAREFVENFTGRSLMLQTWKLTADTFTGVSVYRAEISHPFTPFVRENLAFNHRARTVLLERTPLATVTSVVYWPAVGSVQVTLDSSLYIVQTGASPGKIVLKSDQTWPDLADRPDAVEITFTAGYANAAAIPPTLKHAVSLLVSYFYNERAGIEVGVRTGVEVLPLHLQHILESQRVGGWSA